MKSLARPLRGLASRFSGKFQAVLNEVKAKSGLFLFLLLKFIFFDSIKMKVIIIYLTIILSKL